MADNLFDIVDPQVAGDAIIGVDRDAPMVTLSFSELHERSARLAALIADYGLEPGARVAILAANHIDYVPTLFGIARSGYVACPINWKAGDEGVGFMLSDAGVSLVFCDGARQAMLPPGLPAERLGEEHAGLDPLPLPPMAEQTLACIMYTSGSTGQPKGVPLTHRGYCWGVSQFAEQRAPDKRVLVSAPLYHMNGQCDILINLSQGATTVLMQRFDIDFFLECIEAYRITEIGGVPTMLALAADRIEAGRATDTGTVNSINIGSAPLSGQLAARISKHFPNARITNGYGTTETGFVSFGPHPEGQPRPALSIGYPKPGIDVRIDGGASEGELLLRTPMMSTGYLNRPQATAAKFVDGWYRTGDLVRRDEHGFFYIVGRADDMFVCGGENLFPGEIEQRLEQHGEVAQAAVVPVDDAVKGAVPFAFVVAMPGAELSEQALKDYAIAEGPAFAHPRYVEFLGSMPLASTNKIDKAKLRRLASEQVRQGSKGASPDLCKGSPESCSRCDRRRARAKHPRR